MELAAIGPRLTAACAAALLAAAIAGCGDDEAATTPTDTDDPYLTVAEVGSELERGQLALVRSGGQPDLPDPDGDAAIVATARYAARSGPKFDVIAYPSVAAATDAAARVGDGDEAVRAANVLAVFPRAIEQVDAYRAAARIMRRLAAACSDEDAGGDERLRRVCFGSPAPSEQRDRVDRTEAVEKGAAAVVGGLHYEPVLARRLNPRIAPDEELVDGRRPPAGTVWFAVFVRVCNDSRTARTATDRLALVSASGEPVKPVRPPGATGAFAYAPAELKPGECIPGPATAAERTVDGALVLFAVAPELLADLPVALELTGADGERTRAVLDV